MPVSLTGLRNTTLNIPASKSVRFYKNGRSFIEGVNFNITPLTLEEPITLALSSSYTKLLAGIPKLGHMIGAATRPIWNVSFQYKEMGIQIWEGTEPLAVSFVASLHFTKNAYEEVWLPSKALCNIALPRDLAKSNQGIGLAAPGPDFYEAYSNQTTPRSNGIISLRIGFFYLNPLVVLRAEPTYSSEQDTTGYPTWCKIRFDIQSVYVATRDMINDMGFGGNPSAGGQDVGR